MQDEIKRTIVCKLLCSPVHLRRHISDTRRSTANNSKWIFVRQQASIPIYSDEVAYRTIEPREMHGHVFIDRLITIQIMIINIINDNNQIDYGGKTSWHWL